jgi:hypothetical protein
LCGFSPPHFCGRWKPKVYFIANAKTVAEKCVKWIDKKMKGLIKEDEEEKNQPYLDKIKQE